MCCIFLLVLICVYSLWRWMRSLPRVDGIHKKCVFITGCDTGFGNALARRLDVLGVPVFAGCLTETGATELKEGASERLQTVTVDVSNHESIVEAFQFVKANIPGGAELWGIVNNAGISGRGGVLEFSNRKRFTDVYDVNLIGLIDVTQTFLPLLKQSRGRVVNTSSSVALVPFPFLHPYVTSKHAVRAFSAAIGLEKKPYGIKVACVLPGLFSTNIVKGTDTKGETAQEEVLPQEVKGEFDDEYHAQMLEAHMKFFGTGSTDLTPVINDYEHALFAKNPSREYFPGTYAFIYSYLSLLPPSVVYFILEHFTLPPFRAVQTAHLKRKGRQSGL